MASPTLREAEMALREPFGKRQRRSAFVSPRLGRGGQSGWVADQSGAAHAMLLLAYILFSQSSYFQFLFGMPLYYYQSKLV